MSSRRCCMRLGVVLLLTFAVREIVCIGVEHQLACNVPSGPLDDAKCDVNDIESANTKQLHTILEELANTTYFRLMHINLDGKCRFFEKAVAEAAKCSAGVTQHDLFSPASSEGFSSSPTQPEPLCSVAPGEAQTSASSSGSVGDAQASESSSKSRGSSYFDVSFLTNPLEYLGVWGNAPEEKKELVTNLVDRTISDMEGKSLMDQVRADEESCNNPLLPEFWADMCSNIPTNVSEYVNLQLNPERWTGYNGSHIWNAIYHENCFAKMGGLQEMCYEERVLYRLLSGMHASVNIHIAMSFSPPSRAKNRTSWASSPKHFMDQYGNKPEYLKNLYFAFVVLLRAVRRAGPYLHHWQFTTGSGSPEVARTTQQLVRRLLDSGLMTSCSSVFEAFDESLMFPADDLPSPVSSGSETSATSSSVSVKARLRSQWKGVFHNISSVMDCISCQKCRLHGKIQLLGIGTALKILLLPVTHISASLERSELVALFNTLAKFSSAILAIPRLVDEYLHLVGAFKADLLAENAALPPLPAAALYGSSYERIRQRASTYEQARKKVGQDNTASTTPGRPSPPSPLSHEPRQPPSPQRPPRAAAASEGADAASPTPSRASFLSQPSEGVAGAGGEAVAITWKAVDAGVAAVARASGWLDSATENAIVDGLLRREDDVILLAKHYARSAPERFVEHAARVVARPSRTVTRSSAATDSRDSAAPGSRTDCALRSSVAGGRRGEGGDESHRGGDEHVVDAVIIGGGLAGLSAALTILDAGGRVVLLEKMGHLGGNSAWASSGVNAVDVNDTSTGDSVDIFTADVERAAGRGDRAGANPLVRVLTEGSVDSLAWLRSRLSENLQLDLVGQMGGHSKARTHRPSSGLAGSAIIFALQKQVDKYTQPPAEGGNPAFELRKWTRATRLLTRGEAVVGVEYKEVTAKDQDSAVRTGQVMGRNVLIATGGFASDYAQDSLLRQHRPDLLKYATTNNKGTTGDGHKLALAVGAKAVDLDDVQVHPTGFHNPADPANKVKTLAAEITRGEGALLLHRGGGRFVNELGGRDYVTGRMLDVAKNAPPLAEADGSDGSLLYALVINGKGAQKTAKHIDLYTKKKLLARFDSLEQLAAWSYWNASVSTTALKASFAAYDAAALNGTDQWGKAFFHNTPFSEDPPYYAGLVTPVIHYCMGGLAISADGNVLREDGSAIAGLFAAGEVIGGLHGKNRLGGNALSECVVFGRAIGTRIASSIGSGASASSAPSPPAATPSGQSASEMPALSDTNASRVITWEELATHNTEASCWVGIDGNVYDFTAFLHEHPAGAEAILKYGGQDGSDIFHAIHTAAMLEDFTPIGRLQDGA